MPVPAEVSARVLLVEDNDSMRRYLRTLLERNGFSVMEAADGEAAVGIALQELPDLIVIDLELPGLDGLEASRRIASRLATALIPTIALCARADCDIWRDKALDAGCAACLAKPVNPVRLLETMVFVLEPAGPASHSLHRSREWVLW